MPRRDLPMVRKSNIAAVAATAAACPSHGRALQDDSGQGRSRARWAAEQDRRMLARSGQVREQRHRRRQREYSRVHFRTPRARYPLAAGLPWLRRIAQPRAGRKTSSQRPLAQRQHCQSAPQTQRRAHRWCVTRPRILDVACAPAKLSRMGNGCATYGESSCRGRGGSQPAPSSHNMTSYNRLFCSSTVPAHNVGV